jgi:hypothetical protein
MHNFLQDEMPARILGKIGPLKQATEIIHVAMEIARHHHVSGILYCNHPAPMARRCPKKLDGLVERMEKARWVWHAD